MTPAHLRAGSTAEKLACAWLQQRGLRLLDTNFLCKAGELDLIMQDGECLAIIEVRYRARRDHGGALASVTPAKQKKIIRAACYYLQRYKMLSGMPLRFDVIALHGALDEAEFDWRRGAFDATQHFYSPR